MKPWSSSVACLCLAFGGFHTTSPFSSVLWPIWGFIFFPTCSLSIWEAFCLENLLKFGMRMEDEGLETKEKRGRLMVGRSVLACVGKPWVLNTHRYSRCTKLFWCSELKCEHTIRDKSWVISLSCLVISWNLKNPGTSQAFYPKFKKLLIPRAYASKQAGIAPIYEWRICF